MKTLGFPAPLVEELRLPDDATPELEALYNSWCTAGKIAALPNEGALDLDVLAATLPLTCIFKVDRPGPRFIFRMIGTQVLERSREPVVGKELDEVLPVYLSRSLRQAMQQCVETRVPSLWYVFLAACPAFDETRYQRLVLPFSEGGEEIDSVMLAFSQNNQSFHTFAKALIDMIDKVDDDVDN